MTTQLEHIEEFGIPECVTYISKGSRDVFWCYQLNEPVILEWRGETPFCTCCYAAMNYPMLHTFIANIRKPRR